MLFGKKTPKTAFDVGQKKQSEWKNETFDEKRRFLKVFHWKRVWFHLVWRPWRLAKKFVKTTRNRPKIHNLTFCSDVSQLCLTLFLLICFEHFNCYFTFSSFLHFFPSRRVFIVFVHFLDSLYFVPSRFFRAKRFFSE